MKSRLGLLMVSLAAALLGCGRRSIDNSRMGGTGGGSTPPRDAGGTADSGGGGASGGAGGAGIGGTAGGGPGGGASGAAGSGGGAGSGGSGGGGGAGTHGSDGSVDGCLAASTYADLFAIADPDLCAAAVYTGAKPDGVVPAAMAFGRHGGPLFVTPGPSGAVVYHRITGATTGAFSDATQTVAVGIPSGAVLGSTPADLGFFGWTAVSYAEASPSTKGGIIFTDDAGRVAARYPVNGPTMMGSVAASNDEGRFFHLGLSKLGDTTASQAGLYAADSCGTAIASPSLLPDEDGCPPPMFVCCIAGGLGALAFDTAGNGFMTFTFPNVQQARGFHRGAIGRNQIPTTGSNLFTLMGSGVALAAMAPLAAADGILALQPIDTSTPRALDVVEQRYRVTSVVVPLGEPRPLLSLGTLNLALGLATDGAGRLWVAAPRPSGNLAFVVVDRRSSLRR